MNGDIQPKRIFDTLPNISILCINNKTARYTKEQILKLLEDPKYVNREIYFTSKLNTLSRHLFRAEKTQW